MRKSRLDFGKRYFAKVELEDYKTPSGKSYLCWRETHNRKLALVFETYQVLADMKKDREAKVTKEYPEFKVKKREEKKKSAQKHSTNTRLRRGHDRVKNIARLKEMSVEQRLLFDTA